MSRKVKNVDVATLVAFANEQLMTTDPNPEVSFAFKSGIILMVEKALKESGRFVGFNFVNPEDCVEGSAGHVNRTYLLKSLHVAKKKKLEKA